MYFIPISAKPTTAAREAPPVPNILARCPCKLTSAGIAVLNP